MNRARSIVLCLLVATTSAGAQTPAVPDPFWTALRAHDGPAVERWLRENPPHVFRRSRDLLQQVLAPDLDDATRTVLWDDLRFLRARLPAREAPVARMLERIEAWSEAEVQEYRRVAAELAFLSASSELPPPGLVEELRDVAGAIDADALCLRPLGTLARRSFEGGRVDEGLAQVEWVAVRAERWGDPWSLAWAHEWLGRMRWKRGELRAAVNHLERAAGVDAAMGDAGYRTQLYANVTRLHSSLGEIDRAMVSAEATAASARESGDAGALRTAAELRGGILLDLGDHARALDVALGGLAGAAETARDEPPDESTVRLELLCANVLADVGRLEAALPHARRAHELALTSTVRKTSPLLCIEVELMLGLLLGDLDRPGEGLALLDEAERGFAVAGDPRGSGWVAKNRGWVLLRSGDLAGAAAALERARAVGETLGEPWLEGISALGVAEALVFGASQADPEALDRERATEALALARLRAEELDDLEMSWRCAALEGRLHLLRGEAEAALAELSSAVEGVERWRRRLDAPALLVHALRDRADPYVDAARAAVLLGRVEDALWFAELLHARVLYELRAGDLPRPEEATSDAALELRGKMARLELRLRAAEELLPADRDALRDELRDAAHELDARLLEAELLRGSAGSVLSTEDARDGRLTSAELRARVAASDVDVVLDFLVGPRESFVFRIDAESVRMQRIAVGADELGRAVEGLREPIERFQRGEIALAHMGFDVRAARELHALLIRPCDLPAAARLGIVPDGPLAALPFELLVTGGERGPVEPARPFAHLAGLRFLADDHATTYFGSLAALVPQAPQQRNADPDAADVHVFLAPGSVGVPHANAEREAIVRALGTERVRITRDATPDDVLAGTSGTLHLVGHGRLDAGVPMQGHLVLGGREADASASLPAWRIERATLGPGLAVLSTCHGGEGVWRAGEGLLGLTRSFLAAGRDEVVASVWGVEDESTARFMGLFYEARAAGADTAEALRVARCTLRNEVDVRGFALAHPLFWAGWVLQR